jgi:hypothetical protein
MKLESDAVVIISLKLTEKKIEAAVCPPPFWQRGAGWDFSERKLSIKSPL